jgi:hypothetical protein
MTPTDRMSDEEHSSLAPLFCGLLQTMHAQLAPTLSALMCAIHTKVVPRISALLQPVVEEIEKREAVRPSMGYAPYLMARGVHPIIAKGMAQLILHHARRRADENRRLPEVVRGIKYLSAHHRRKDAVRRRADNLLKACHETSIIETIFDDAGADERQFIEALKAVSKGQWQALSTLQRITQSITPHLPYDRGPRLTEASAAHEFFLRQPHGGLQRRYTRVVDSHDFSDPMTQATRSEYGDPEFTPVAAVRRLKAAQQRHQRAMGSVPAIS